MPSAFISNLTIVPVSCCWLTTCAPVYWHGHFCNIMEVYSKKTLAKKEMCSLDHQTNYECSFIREMHAIIEPNKLEALNFWANTNMKVVCIVKRIKRNYIWVISSWRVAKNFWKIKRLSGRQCLIPTLNFMMRLLPLTVKRLPYWTTSSQAVSTNVCLLYISLRGGFKRLNPSDCLSELFCTGDEVL